MGEGKPAEIVRLDAARGGGRVRLMRTPSGPPVRTAIAPIQVGALLAPDRLGAVAVHRAASCTSPSSRSMQARWLHALLEHEHARLVLATRATATHSESCGGVELVEQIDRGAAPRAWDRVMRREVLVDQRDGHRALPDRARDALDRPRADVAGDEDARHVRLEHVGLALERPAVALYVGAGQDEAALVAGDHALEPVGVRRGADEHEAGVDVERGLVPSASRMRMRAQAAVVALRRDRRGPGADVDVRRAGRAARSGSATSSARAGAAHEHRDLSRVAR